MSPTTKSLRLGTRASALARWQADWVSGQLRARDVDVEIVLITTGGDVTKQPISAVGGQGLFTKEIQRALLDQRIDFAVHSLKDLPTEKVTGLLLAAVPPREDPFDAFVSNHYDGLDQLPNGARVGTGSLRRKSQLLHIRPDLDVRDIRGNVDTRLKKLDDGGYDAIILAAAGLHRLQLSDRIREKLTADKMLPAIGQGALGIECRSEDSATREAIELLNDPATYMSVLAERTLLATLQGGCLAPVAGWARLLDDQLKLDGAALSADGSERLSASRAGPPESFADLGQSVANELLDQGADRLIAASRA